MGKNILYIWDADYPWDIRVDKICSTLSNAGHTVHIAARNLKKQPLKECYNGMTIHRLPFKSNNKLNYVFSFPLFFSPVWKKFLDKIVHQEKIDLIIVRDLPMAAAGINAGKRNNIPVLFDMAEDYMAMLKDIWKYRKFDGFNLLVRNPYLAKFVETYVMKNSDAILTVVEEAAEIAVLRGANKKNVFVVSNTPRPEELHPASEGTVPSLISSRFSMIYTGGIQKGRGLQVVIEAIPKIIKKITDFLFVVVGDGYALSHLKQIAEQKGVADYIQWCGWVQHDHVYDYIRASKIGVIPHFKTPHTDSTVPNKLFDYMGLGIPVLATDAKPLKRILAESEAGVTYRNLDVDDFVDKTFYLKRNLGQVKNAGIKAVQLKYNWNVDAKELLAVIDKF